MSEVAAVLKALAELTWAVIAAWALIAFRKEIASILNRLRSFCCGKQFFRFRGHICS